MFEELCFNLGRDASKEELRSALKEADLRDRERVLKGFREEENERWSLLMGVSSQGRPEMVSLLLEEFQADPNLLGSVRSPEGILREVTALWCASGKGQLSVVQALLSGDADVNLGESTPVRAASFHGYPDILEALANKGADIHSGNEFNGTPLMLASSEGHLPVVQFLLSRGVNPEVRTKCGLTALHFACEGGHLDVVKEICRKCPHIIAEDSPVLNPLRKAAVNCREDLVDYLIQLPVISDNEKILALELLGSSFANDSKYEDLRKAFLYMRKSIVERESKNIAKSIGAALPAYENLTEITTLTELNSYENNDIRLQMEGLIIKERILGAQHDETLKNIIYRGFQFMSRLMYANCISLWLHALQARKLKKLCISKDLLRLATVYSQMLKIKQRIDLVNFSIIFEESVDNLHACFTKECTDNAKEDSIMNVLFFLAIFDSLKSTVPMEKFDLIQTQICRLCKINPKTERGYTLLHLVVDEETQIKDYFGNTDNLFPSAGVTKTLLEAGINSCAFNKDGDTPLHIISRYEKQVKDFLTIYTIITLLIDAGAHTDAVNERGEFPVDTGTKAAEVVLKNRSQLRLSCLSAQSVYKHNIIYSGVVPKSVERFLQLHGMRKKPV